MIIHHENGETSAYKRRFFCGLLLLVFQDECKDARYVCSEIPCECFVCKSSCPEQGRGKRGSYAVLMDNDFSHMLGMTMFFRFVFSSGIICSIALFCRYYGQVQNNRCRILSRKKGCTTITQYSLFSRQNMIYFNPSFLRISLGMAFLFTIYDMVLYATNGREKQ